MNNREIREIALHAWEVMRLTNDFTLPELDSPEQQTWRSKILLHELNQVRNALCECDLEYEEDDDWDDTWDDSDEDEEDDDDDDDVDADLAELDDYIGDDSFPSFLLPPINDDGIMG
jgi:hypothetical protein